MVSLSACLRHRQQGRNTPPDILTGPQVILAVPRLAAFPAPQSDVMRSSAPHSFTVGKRKGVIWLDICVILVLLGIMGGLAWTGWQRSQKSDSDRAAKPAGQKELSGPPNNAGG
ncbi:MAG: hypothetical protein JWM59_4987 [Verrucomicrobiales bacterium]|nr:hypothetical protein [Verrucomicrobiales bacterium]